MRTTKQKRRYMITLPPEAMAVPRWHVDTQLATPEEQDSELLLPAVHGKLRSVSVLDKPLDDVGTELGLKKQITQRALRRTFNDLARAAQVNDLVTRSRWAEWWAEPLCWWAEIRKGRLRGISQTGPFLVTSALLRRAGEGISKTVESDLPTR